MPKTALPDCDRILAIEINHVLTTNWLNKKAYSPVIGEGLGRNVNLFSRKAYVHKH